MDQRVLISMRKGLYIIRSLLDHTEILRKQRRIDEM